MPTPTDNSPETLRQIAQCLVGKHMDLESPDAKDDQREKSIIIVGDRKRFPLFSSHVLNIQYGVLFDVGLPRIGTFECRVLAGGELVFLRQYARDAGGNRVFRRTIWGKRPLQYQWQLVPYEWLTTDELKAFANVMKIDLTHITASDARTG